MTEIPQPDVTEELLTVDRVSRLSARVLLLDRGVRMCDEVVAGRLSPPMLKFTVRGPDNQPAQLEVSLDDFVHTPELTQFFCGVVRQALAKEYLLCATKMQQWANETVQQLTPS